MLETQRKQEHKPFIVFYIDHQQFKTTSTHLTVRQILTEFAKENPANVSLALKHGKELKRYTNLDENICLENGMHFVVFHETPTTVS
jgi:hypothetical protein